MGFLRRRKKEFSAEDAIELTSERTLETHETLDPGLQGEPAVQFEPYVLVDPTLLTFVDPNSKFCIEELVCLYPWLSHLNYCGFTTPHEAEMFKLSFMAAIMQKAQEVNDLDTQILLQGYLHHVRNRIPNAIGGQLINALVERRKTVRITRENLQKKGRI